MGYVRFMDLITSTDALAAACHRLSQHPFVTVDTEFLRETTYYPKLCLIQMAGPDPTDAYLIGHQRRRDQPRALHGADVR